jgi:hypothetical protein
MADQIVISRWFEDQIVIRIGTGNDAFSDDPQAEVSRILRDLADKCERGAMPDTLRDINGNKCGIVAILAD